MVSVTKIINVVNIRGSSHYVYEGFSESSDSGVISLYPTMAHALKNIKLSVHSSNSFMLLEEATVNQPRNSHTLNALS